MTTEPYAPDLSDLVTLPLSGLGGVHRCCDNGDEPKPWRWFCAMINQETDHICHAHGRADTDGEASDSLTAHLRGEHGALGAALGNPFIPGSALYAARDAYDTAFRASRQRVADHIRALEAALEASAALYLAEQAKASKQS